MIGRQLTRSGTSIGANYRAACRGKSTADVIAKLRIVEEEADESAYWMELLIESGLVPEARLSELLQETNEIIAMTVASIRTLQKRDRSSPFNRQSKTYRKSKIGGGMKHIAGLQAIFMTLATCGEVAQAQQPGRIPRIGYVSGTGNSANPGPYVEALRQGLRDLGHIDGKNIVIEYRGADGKADRYPKPRERTRATQSRCPCRPTYSISDPRSQAGDQDDSHCHGDPGRSSRDWANRQLGAPGGNITGLATLSRELSGKRLELVKEVVPRISRVAVLRDADSEGAAIGLKEYEAVARISKDASSIPRSTRSKPRFGGRLPSRGKGTRERAHNDYEPACSFVARSKLPT